MLSITPTTPQTTARRRIIARAIVTRNIASANADASHGSQLQIEIIMSDEGNDTSILRRLTPQKEEEESLQEELLALLGIS